MFSKLKNKAKDKSEEMIEEHIPKIKTLLKEKVGIKAKDAFENDELMTTALSRVYDLLIISHPTIRLFIKRERFISFGLSNRNRLIDWRDTRSLPPLTEQQSGKAETQNTEKETVMPKDDTLFNPPQDFMDFEKARIYLGAHTPEQVVSDSPNWPCDATDLLSIADICRMFLKADDHAIALYKEGLRLIKQHPEKRAPDTNLAGAYANLGNLLTNQQRSQEAIDAYEVAIEEEGGDHPEIRAWLAFNLRAVGRFRDALRLAEEALQIPPERLNELLLPDAIKALFNLRADLLKLVGQEGDKTPESSESFETRSQTELKAAPQAFLRAFYTLGNANPKQSMEALSSAMPYLKQNAPDWVGTAFCCYAYCWKEVKQYQEAITFAEQGRQLGLSLMGHWYYHDVVVQALNYLDDLPRALQAAEAAIQFFHNEKSPGNEADHLSRKANILKQIAFPLSIQAASITEAKAYTLQAIEAICKSLSITSEGWEDLAEELDGLARIAARVNVKPGDLKFLERMNPQILPIIKQYFGV